MLHSYIDFDNKLIPNTCKFSFMNWISVLCFLCVEQIDINGASRNRFKGSGIIF